MLLYDCATAPSPRRVRIFLAEKGLQVPMRQIDLRQGEHLGEAYRAINPQCVVPYLVLDDGTGIGEMIAICRYFEEVQPDPPLMGRDPKSKALVTMWDHRCEAEGMFAVAEWLRNTSRGLRNRAVTGERNFAQIPELGERGRQRTQDFFQVLDQRLAASRHLAGDDFSVADITALITVDFAAWLKLGLDDTPNLKRWHDEVSARPSAKA